jgi:hypothetical protein
MGFRSIGELAESLHIEGANWQSFFVKTSTPAPQVAGCWYDLSMGAGVPKYNAYVGNQAEATPLINVSNAAIYTGPTPPPGATKHLTSMSIAVTANAAPVTFLLCDYLLAYPLIDGDDDGVQYLDNSQGLPRYSDGIGVVCAIFATSPMSGNGTATINFTDCDGNSRTVTFGIRAASGIGASVVRCNTSGSDNSNGPFVPAPGRGIRSIESFQFSPTVGGMMVLVLMKPLESIFVREQNTVTEKILPLHGVTLPRIHDDAFLDFLFCSGTANAPTQTRGFLTFAWR